MGHTMAYRRFIIAFIFLTGFSYNAHPQSLSGQLAARDSVLFNAVLNTCNIAAVDSIFSPSFEFYQDQGDENAANLTTREEFMHNIEKRCQNKNTSSSIRRILIKGSLSVSTINDSQATQSGIQRFYLSQDGNPEQMVEENHFTRLWELKNNTWKMIRELDYQIITPSPHNAADTHNELYKAVTGADSTLFAAYNNRDLAALKKMFSEDLEFFHDKGGLSLYADNMQNFDNHFKDTASFARRELVEGSVKIYPLNNYGALEMGVHRFYIKTDGKERLTATANFINTWHWVNGQWKLSRVITYDHR